MYVGVQGNGEFKWTQVNPTNNTFVSEEGKLSSKQTKQYVILYLLLHRWLICPTYSTTHLSIMHIPFPWVWNFGELVIINQSGIVVIEKL
jgi:hypothetical protein